MCTHTHTLFNLNLFSSPASDTEWISMENVPEQKQQFLNPVCILELPGKL